MSCNTHSYVCTGDADCSPLDGFWPQPSGIYVDAARDQLDEDVPWCQVHTVAWELAEPDEAIDA